MSVPRVSDLDRVPVRPAVDLLVLCYTLSPKECADAVACAKIRWPGVKELALVSHGSRQPSHAVGKLLHTLDAPAPLLTMVGELVGYAGSSACSHIY
jgi:hypothetical protein